MCIQIQELFLGDGGIGGTGQQIDLAEQNDQMYYVE